jgi:hypothetical protein
MFYAFDVLVRRGEDLTKQTLAKRRENPVIDSQARRSRRYFAGIQPDGKRDAHLREESRLGRNHCKTIGQSL